jgi:hypothetical protein
MNTRFDWKRFLIILLAFISGVAVPIQLITLSFGYAQYIEGIPKGPEMIKAAHDFAMVYIPYVYLPALVLLLSLTFYSKNRYPDVYRRIVVGFGFGALATFALDAIRQIGVIHNFLPGDTPIMFGKMITLGNTFLENWPVGMLVHILNGASFGLFYAFVFGKRKSYKDALFWALLWGMTQETLMMIGPPMAPMVGPFGINYSWPGLFIITLIAHVFFATTYGLLIQTFLKKEDKGWLWVFLVEKSKKTSSND